MYGNITSDTIKSSPYLSICLFILLGSAVVCCKAFSVVNDFKPYPYGVTWNAIVPGVTTLVPTSTSNLFNIEFLDTLSFGKNALA